jgi:hypothetical protein
MASSRRKVVGGGVSLLAFAAPGDDVVPERWSSPRHGGVLTLINIKARQ